MNRIALLVGGLVVIPLVVFLGLALRFDPTKIDSPLIGKPAPDFTLKDMYGQVFSLKALRGQPVLINFWASWCQPCLVEHPLLVAGARRYQGKAHFLGVIYQDEPHKIQNLLGRYGAWGPSLLDNEGQVAIAYGVYGVPETYLIDADGIIVDKVTSALQPGYLERVLDELIENRPPTSDDFPTSTEIRPTQSMGDSAESGG